MHKKIKTTITLSHHIKEFASKDAESLGLDFSAYVTVLIAEKMRGTNIIGANPTTPSIISSVATEEIAASKAEIEIDNSQIDELDRLLSLKGADE